MNEIKLAKLPDEFDVAQHFDLGDGTLLLFFRGKGAISLVIN